MPNIPNIPNKSNLKKKTLKKSEINKLSKIQLKEELNNVIETLTVTKLKNLLILLTEETNIKNTEKSVKVKKDSKDDARSIVEMVKSIEIIDDTGIEKKNSNGGRTQTILMKYNDKYWKLVIHSESYWFQSYIKLYSSQSLENWNLVKQGNPKQDYSLDISNRNDYRENIFFGIINDYKFLIARLEK